MSTSIYTLDACGCLRLAVVQGRPHSPAMQREIANELRDGFELHVIDTPELRKMPWRCDEHRRVEAERATLVPLGL